MYGSLGSFVGGSYAEHELDCEPMEGVLRDLLGALRGCGGRQPLALGGAGSALKRLKAYSAAEWRIGLSAF